MRRLRLWPLVAALVMLLLATAPAAYGHSALIATEPLMDSVAMESPPRILLRFDEAIEEGLILIRVYDAQAREIPVGEVSSPTPEEAALSLPDELEPGTYTVIWRVISADSDPINGHWMFHVERKSEGDMAMGVADQVVEDTPSYVTFMHYGGRFLDFLFLVLCVGGVAVLALALGGAGDDLRRRLLRLVVIFAPLLAIVALIGLPLQGAVARGTGLSEAFTSDVISSVADTRYGQFSIVRVVLAILLAFVALIAARSGSRGVGLVALGIAAVLIFTPGLAGHASVAGPGAIAADAAHVQAASIWAGGLAFVLIALVLSSDRWNLAASSVPRFSTMAVISVAVLLIAGSINGYLQVRTWSGLWETEYGVLLLIKIGLIVPLLAIGAYNNRRVVPRLREKMASNSEQRRFLRFVGAELAIMVVILGITAALVNAPPARNVETDPAPAPEPMMGAETQRR
jgi:copper transport protein